MGLILIEYLKSIRMTDAIEKEVLYIVEIFDMMECSVNSYIRGGLWRIYITDSDEIKMIIFFNSDERIDKIEFMDGFPKAIK